MEETSTAVNNLAKQRTSPESDAVYRANIFDEDGSIPKRQKQHRKVTELYGLWEPKYTTNCGICHDLEFVKSSNPEVDTNSDSMFSSWNALIESADEGCLSCLFLKKAFETYLPLDYQPQTGVSWEVSRDDDRTLNISRAVEGKKYYWTENIEFYKPERHAAPWDGIRTQKHIGESTGSEQSLARLKVWTEICTNFHLSCGRGLPAILPTRIVDVGYDAEAVRLFEGSSDLRARYICLSHCWGHSRILVTTRANIEDHKAEIPWVDLPQTFREAIMVTRKLEIRYLWIDSLCIIQDDADDWEREADSMASVYQNAFLTIAATTSSGDRSGLFSSSPTTRFEALVENGQKFAVFGRQAIIHPKLLYETSNKSFPLLDRGWVYQERLLSPRVVHFCSGELVWECQEDTTCECERILTYGNANDRANKEQWARAQTKVIHSISLQNGTKSLLLASRWRQMVVEYTRLRLTVKLDRLPALAGLARQSQGVRGCRYLFGLWEDSLLEDLLWKWDSYIGHPSATEPHLYLPSWSWASGTGTVEYPLRGKVKALSYADYYAVINTPCCQIVSVQYPGENFLGKSVSGYLEIEGHLLQCNLLRNGNCDNLRTSFGRTVTAWLDFDVQAPGPYHVDLNRPVFCLALGETLHQRTETGYETYAIVVVPTGKESTYRRIGLVMDIFWEDYSDHSHPLIIRLV